MALYHEGNRSLQDRFDTRRLADRIAGDPASDQDGESADRRW